MRILYVPNEPLKNDETLLYRRGLLFRENLNVRSRRFTLINLFTNHRYDKTRVINRLISEARWGDMLTAEKILNDADSLLARAKAEAPSLSKYRFVRWIKGKPLVNIADLEQRIADARKILPKPEPIKIVFVPLDFQIARQKALDSLTLTKEKTIEFLEQAKKVCPPNSNHEYVLTRWILVAKNQQKIIEGYDKKNDERDPYEKQENPGFLYSDPISRVLFHGEQEGQDPGVQMYKGLEAYALIFQKARQDDKLLKSFFESALSTLPCFDGSYRALTEWADKTFNLNQDLIIDLSEKNTPYQNLGELHRAFEAHQFRAYFQKILYTTYDERNEVHLAEREKYYTNKATLTMKKFQEENLTKEKLAAFIHAQNAFPIKCKDIEITADNFQELFDRYYDDMG